MKNQTTPVFIKLDNYKKILSSVDDVKKRIVEVNKTIQEIEELRLAEQQELNQWKTNIAEISEEISFVDATLFEPEHM
jgi:predicted DNA-binding protein (UPF0251 family)